MDIVTNSSTIYFLNDIKVLPPKKNNIEDYSGNMLMGCLDHTLKLYTLSHRTFKYMHEVLNIG